MQIAELLAAMTAQRTVDDALGAVVDGVAETFDAEIVLVVGREGVRRSLGFGAADPPRELVLASRNVEEVTGVGRCHVRAVPLSDPELDRLVLARTGGPYGEEETALLSGVARTIELSLRSIRSLARERELREAAAENAHRQGLLVSELRYRGAFDEALLSISQTLLTGDPSNAESAVSVALERLAGFLDLVHARIDLDGGVAWVAWGDQPTGAASRTVELRLAASSRPDARLVVVGSSGSPVDREGTALLEVVADLIANTLDRRETRAALELANRELRRSNVELERVNRDLRAMNEMKDDFVSMTSHELRTPLTAIQGFAETVVERGEHLTTEVTRDLARRIHGQATRLGRLVGDILDISRLESEEVDVRAEEVTVRDLVLDLLELWADEPVPEVQLDDEQVRADPDQLRRILLNYVENARKYGAPPIRIAGRPEGDELAITVTDNGPGVPSGFRSDLFEKFQQASQGTRRSSTGTGLGLAIVRRLARLNGGEAGYETAPGGGACFWVRLPAVTPARTPDAHRTPADAARPERQP